MVGTKKEEYGGPVCECIGWHTPFTLLFLPASFIRSGLLCSFSHTFLRSPSEPFSPVLICCPSLTRLLPVFYPLCPHNLSVAPPLFPSFCIGVFISLVPRQNSQETVQDDSGKWRDNPKDFQGFKVFVLAIINCTGCNYHKHTGSENRNKDKHIVLHQFGYFNTQVSTREKHSFWWHEPSNMKILLINTLSP